MLLPQIIGGLLQEKPKVPPFRAVDAQIEQKKAIGGNIDAFDKASELGDLIDADTLKRIEKFAPGTMEMLGKSRGVIDSQLSGELPQGVVDQIRRRSAEFGAGSGTAGSQFQGFSGLRQLGIESLAYTQAGLDNASRWLGGSRANVPQFNIGSMFITPQEQIAHSVNERDKKMSQQWLKNQIGAAYAPGTIVGQAIIKTDDQIMQMASSVAGAAAGKAI